MEREREFENTDNIGWNQSNIENWLSSVSAADKSSNQKELDSSGESIHGSSSSEDDFENSANNMVFQPYIEDDNDISSESEHESEATFDDGEMFVNRPIENTDSPPNVYDIYWGWTSDEDDDEMFVNHFQVFGNSGPPPNMINIYWGYDDAENDADDEDNTDTSS